MKLYWKKEQASRTVGADHSVMMSLILHILSIRLDENVLNFYKGKNPKGFTACMAAVLTAYANAHQDK